MTEPVHTLTMRLSSTPFPNRSLRAHASALPLESDNDFAVFATIPRNNIKVMVLHPHQHRLIAELVGTLLQWEPGIDAILLTMKMPTHIRLPVDLLSERVFMLGDVRYEESKLGATGQRIAVVDNGIISAPFEKGDNCISTRFHNMDDATEVAAALEALLGKRGMLRADTV